MVNCMDKFSFFKKPFYLPIIFTFSCFFLSGCTKYSDEVQANLTKLKKTKACPGCDLTGIELINFDLKNADLSGANLTGANLKGSDLTGANLIGANLTDTDLLGTDLTNAKLINGKLSGVKLNPEIKKGAEISGAELKDKHTGNTK